MSASCSQAPKSTLHAILWQHSVVLKHIGYVNPFPWLPRGTPLGQCSIAFNPPISTLVAACKMLSCSAKTVCYFNVDDMVTQSGKRN